MGEGGTDGCSVNPGNAVWPTLAGGVCIDVHSSIHCHRLHNYELARIESVRLRLRPRRLPRLLSVVLMAVVYHPTSCGTNDNRLLLQQLQSNINSFLCQLPEGLVVITGDFNPTSPGLSVTDTKHLTALSQTRGFDQELWYFGLVLDQ